MTTFDEATTFANETGWYIHQLWQEVDGWGCVVREAEGGDRRNIARGKGSSAAGAIYDALSNASEVEAEVNVVISDNIAIASGDGISDLLALIGTKPLQPTRTRA